MYPQRGTAGTGAVLSLYAVGKQENYLNSKDPKNPFFNPKYLKHTDFSTTLRNHIVQKESVKQIEIQQENLGLKVPAFDFLDSQFLTSSAFSRYKETHKLVDFFSQCLNKCI